MASTNQDYVIITSVILGLSLAVLVGLFLGWIGASGDLLWVPTVGSFVAGAFLVVKSCPRCHQLICRGFTKYSECTADL